MVPIVSLWAPIVLAAVIVFLASSLLHMVLPFHRGDYKKLAAEDDVMDALRKFDIPPGDYLVPCVTGTGPAERAAHAEKRKRGPALVMTVLPSGPPEMGRALWQWFVYCLLVGVFAAYLAGRTLPTGTSYLLVFRVAGCTAFTGYSLALLQQSIWYRRSWGTTLRLVADGLLYGLLTGGTFGWLWPK